MMTLTTQGQRLVANAMSPAYLAAGAIHHLASADWDQTSWTGCIGGHIAQTAGFRPGADPHHTHTGDTYWCVLEALMGDVRLGNGLSLFAPEATAADLGPALHTIVDRNADREAIAA